MSSDENFSSGVFFIAPCSSASWGSVLGSKNKGHFFLLGASLFGGGGWRVATAICRLSNTPELKASTKLIQIREKEVRK